MMAEEVIGMTGGLEPAHQPARRGERVSLDELARRRGVRPVTSLDEMREDGVFDSDQELDEFLQYLQESRRSDLG
jgi:hypothetical protein